MAFMQKQVEYGKWIQVDGPCGIDSIPFDLVGKDDPKFADVKDYTENREAWSIEVVTGFGARLSAPGYMDCTAWSVFDTEKEARDSLDDDDEFETDDPFGDESESQEEWSGSPDANDPDNFWIDDETGERVNATTGERSKQESDQ